MSFQFDEFYYRQNNTDVNAAIEAGWFENGQAHYNQFGWIENRNPNADFDTSYYLDENPDVGPAVLAGDFESPLQHFLLYGAAEGRAPSAAAAELLALFDGDAYLAANPDVADAIADGDFQNAVQHYQLYGQFENRPGLPELPPVGETFALTQGVDAGADFTGGDADDTFNAPAEQTAFLPIQTLGNGDDLDGAGGRDVLNASLVNAYTVPAGLTSIEEINLDAPGIVLGLGLFTPTLDLANADSVDTLGFRGLNNGAEIDNLTTKLETLNIRDVSQNPAGLLLVPAEFEVNTVGDVLDGAEDELAINFQNVSDNDVLSVPVGLGAVGIDLDTNSGAPDAGYEVLNINSTGQANFVEVYGDAVDFTTHTVNITGDAELDINHGHVNSASGGPVVWNAAALNLINAAGDGAEVAAFSGDLFTEVGGDGEVEVRSGTGNDVLDFGEDVDATVFGNDGDDEISFYQIVGGPDDGTTSFDADDSVDGGEGNDELWLDADLGELLVDGVGDNITNVERIVHWSTDTVSGPISVDMSRSGSAMEVEFWANYDGNDVTVTELTNDDTVIISGDDIDDLELVHASPAGLNDQINLTFETQDGFWVTIDEDLIVASDVEQLNIVANGEGNVDIENADEIDTNILLTGDANVTIGEGDAYDFTGLFGAGVIDAEEATGDLEIYLGLGSQNVLLGSGDDLVVLEGSGYLLGSDLIDLSAGGSDAVRFTTTIGNNGFEGPLDTGLYHHVLGFDVSDDEIQIDVSGIPINETDTGTVGAGNPTVMLTYTSGTSPIANSGVDYNFIKFATVQNTGGLDAEQVFDQAMGTNSIDVDQNAEYLASYYDLDNEQMVLFTVDAGGDTLINSGDDIDVIGTVGMSQADYALFNGDNISFVV